MLPTLLALLGRPIVRASQKLSSKAAVGGKTAINSAMLRVITRRGRSLSRPPWMSARYLGAMAGIANFLGVFLYSAADSLFWQSKAGQTEIPITLTDKTELQQPKSIECSQQHKNSGKNFLIEMSVIVVRQKILICHSEQGTYSGLPIAICIIVRQYSTLL